MHPIGFTSEVGHTEIYRATTNPQFRQLLFYTFFFLAHTLGLSHQKLHKATALRSFYLAQRLEVFPTRLNASQISFKDLVRLAQYFSLAFISSGLFLSEESKVSAIRQWPWKIPSRAVCQSLTRSPKHWVSSKLITLTPECIQTHSCQKFLARIALL